MPKGDKGHTEDRDGLSSSLYGSKDSAPLLYQY